MNFAGVDSSGHHFRKLHRNVYIAPDVDPTLPAEIVRPGKLRSCPGIVVRTVPGIETCVVDGIETCVVDGMTVTTPARTGFDLARSHDTDRAVEMVDALCNATGLKIPEIEAVAERHKGARHLVRMRTVLELADGGAASPPETHTRLLLVRAGLPRPETQIEIFDDAGFVARADMGWKEWRVLVEYDGVHHWTDPAQRTLDIDRYTRLPELGWTVIRVGADLLYRRPHVLVERVRRALREAGVSV